MTAPPQRRLATTAAAARQDLTHLGREAAVALGGLVTTLAVVWANHWAAEHWRFDLLSVSLYFVFPVGALIGGMASAFGYYGAARLTQTLPSRQLMWSMVAIAAGAWFYSHWLDYSAARFNDGTPVRAAVGFAEFFRFTTEHQVLNVTSRGSGRGVSTGELGAWGYLREALQLAGFGVGGFVVYHALTNVEACAACRRYARVTSVMRRVSPEQFDAGLRHAGVPSHEVATNAGEVVNGRPFVGMNLKVARCPDCGDAWLRPEVVVRSGRNEVPERLARWDAEPAQAEQLLALPREYRKAP